MEFDSNKPIFLQIADSFHEKILSGELNPGDRIMSVRELGGELGVNPNTVMRSYEKMTASGIIYNKRGIGYFISDDSLKVIPLNYYSNIESLKTDDRLIATFTIPSGEVTNPVEVEFTSFVKMVPQDILQTSAPDTVGNDPADPQVMWQSGGIEGTSRFLTINFIYQASTSGIQHKIYLIDDLTAENPDEDGYYHLKFRHDANKDQLQLSASSVATFPLPEKYTAPGIKGIKVDFNTISEEKDSTLTVNFK